MRRPTKKIACCTLLVTLAAGCGGTPSSDEPAAQSAGEQLSAGGDPLFKFVLQDSTRLDHLYTTDWNNEGMSAQAAGYVDYGPVGRCFSTQQPGTIPLYRLYSRVAVDHFYTTSAAEAGSAQSVGYAYEGIACYVYPQNAAGTCPFFRYYYSGGSVVGYDDHFYTESGREGALAVQDGYRYEGIAAFLSPYGDSCPQ